MIDAAVDTTVGGGLLGKLLRRLSDGEVPAKLILDLALLDAFQGGQELGADGAGLELVVHGVVEGVAAGLHGDALDGDQRGRGPGRHDLLELGQLLVGDAPPLDGVAEDVPGDLARGLGRDGLDDVLAVGDDDGGPVPVPAHAEEARGRELVDLAPGLAVEVQRDAVARVPGALAVPQHGRVVAAHLGAARPLGGGAVKVLEDQGVDRVHAVVDARRHHEDHERVLVGRAEAELRARPEQQRPDVHGRAGLVGRDELGVQGHGEVDALHEQVLGHGGHGDVLGGPLHALGVLVGAEDGDAAVGLAEGLHPLVTLHAVVQTGRHAVDGEVGGGDPAWFAPRRVRTGRVAKGGLDVAVDLADFEADIAPVSSQVRRQEWNKKVVLTHRWC